MVSCLLTPAGAPAAGPTPSTVPATTPATAPAAPPSTAPAPDGTVVESGPGESVDVPYRQYASYLERKYDEEAESERKFGLTPAPADAYRRARLTREQYDLRLHDPRFECLRILYMSDGLKVVGYVFKPAKVEAGKRLPTIIYNRGGHADLDEVGTISLLELHPFLGAGFVVLAPQYRGSDGGEGKDEFGGADVHDVLNMVAVARSLGYVDTDNLFMYGVSRGGMETYLALKQHAPVNAAAVLAAPSDEEKGEKQREFADVYRELVPGFDRDPQAAYRARSAVCWPEAIDKPLLMLHGGNDWRVSPSQSLALASRLQELHRPYQLLLYADDDHDLTLHREERDRQIVDWFRRHLKQP